MGTLCSGPFRSKPVRSVSTKMNLKCATNKRTKSEQETRTRKIIWWLPQTWQRRPLVLTTDQTKNIRNEKLEGKKSFKRQINKNQNVKLVMSFSASLTIKTKRSEQGNQVIHCFIKAVLECCMTARLASQACHYDKMKCRVKRSLKEKRKEKLNWKNKYQVEKSIKVQKNT